MRNSIGALATQRYQRRPVRSGTRPRDGPRDARATLRPVEPLLLITNSEAGSNDEENLDKALAVLRAATDVEVAATSNQGELDGVLHRRGGRHVVVAGGDGSLHAVIAALQEVLCGAR